MRRRGPGAARRGPGEGFARTVTATPAAAVGPGAARGARGVMGLMALRRGVVVKGYQRQIHTILREHESEEHQ